jgi:hypothetical protein
VQKAHDGVGERIERMMHQHVAARDRLERRAGRAQLSKWPPRIEPRIAHRGIGSQVELRQASKIHQPVDFLDVGEAGGIGAGVLATDILEQERAQHWRHTSLDLDANHGALATLRRRADDLVEEIVGIGFVELELRCARDAKDERLLDLNVRRIDRREIPANDILECHEHLLASRFTCIEEARRVGRQVELGEARTATGAIAQDDRQRKGKMAEPRQRMAGAQRHCEGREQRLDLGSEPRTKHFALRLAQLGPRPQANTTRGKGRETLAKTSSLSRRNRRHALADRRELLAQREAVVTDFVRRVARRRETRHANHEEFVDVGADDRQETKALAQRCERIFGQRQHTMLE